MQSTILVVPCYNEADRLDMDAFRTFSDATSEIGFMFVDDGSRDRTWDALGGLEAERPTVFRRMRLERNSGKAEAVRLGMAACLDVAEGTPRYVGFWDADLATPLAVAPDLASILDARPDTDAVFGSRVRLLGRNIERHLSRHITGRVFATFASLLLRLPVYDTQCGAKLFRAGEPLRDVLSDPFLTRWIFDVEMIARMQRTGRARIYEFPLPEWRDEGGSKIRFRHYLQVPFDLLRIYRHYGRPDAG